MRSAEAHRNVCADADLAAVLLATGTSVAVLVPVAARVLIMGAMMAGMGMLGSDRHDGHWDG